DQDSESQLPSGLALNQLVRFNQEYDAAKYDCSPNIDTPVNLRAAITNDNGSGGLKPDASNNWGESQNYLDYYAECTFCCGTASPPIPQLSGPEQVLANSNFVINISGSLPSGEAWELYTECGIGQPIATTMSNSFSLVAPAV